MRGTTHLKNARNHEPGHDQRYSRSHRCGSWVGHGGPGSFFGVETESMSPKSQIAAALTTLAPVALSGVFLVVFVPQLWWIFTTYGWVSFPAFGLLARGLAELYSEPSGKQKVYESARSKERELLEALRDHGELSPAQVAMETSLSVAEADRMLEELSKSGYLEVRARDGGLFYALWDPARSVERRRDALE
ncbi:MAG: hypothetical protein M3N10_04195 [Actinomycetota bacterium]|nr:hypothetical protein [Actinomycetota bacterium]